MQEQFVWQQSLDSTATKAGSIGSQLARSISAEGRFLPFQNFEPNAGRPQ
jgi:hypothetical protein